MGLMKKVLLTLPFSPDLIRGLDGYIRAMAEKGFEVVLAPERRTLQEEETIKLLEGACAFVVAGECVSEKVFAACPDLKVVSRMGVGFDKVDIPAATARKIAVTITPAANAEAVAEYAFSLMLALSRKVILIDKKTREGEWTPIFGTTLYRKTLGIMGTGNIGKILAKLVQGFGMRVLVYDKYRDDQFAAATGAVYCELDELLAQSDFISVHLPLLPETNGLLSDREFSLMKHGVQIVNCARGGIIDEDALLRALNKGVVLGAALDVFEQEPPEPDNALLTHENVIVSCHTAGMTFECRGDVVKTAFQNVVDILEGRSPKGLLNPEALQ